MRVLITGATGFVGGHLVEHLAARGDQIVGLARGTRWPEPLSHLTGLARLESLDLSDCAEDELVEWLRRKLPEVVYHLAAWSNPSKSLADPRGTWAVNLGGTLNLLEGLRVLSDKFPDAPRPRVVLVGSGVCYGNARPEHIPINENCPLRPNNPYAASKAAADLLGVQHHLAHGADVVIARPFNHAGPRQTDDYVLSSLTRQVAEVEAGLRDAVAHGDLEVVRDFTDVRDIVRAHSLLAEKGRAGEIYNIGTNRDVSLGAMLEMLRGMARAPIATRVDSARLRAVDQPRLLADATKLRRDTGWEPLYSIEQTLENMLDYWRQRIVA
jgi:GDP-4-dehydro-6-deoxy-D-mannose reductase